MAVAKRETVNRHHRGFLTCEFEQINSPGLYIENQTGILFRVPSDALISGRSPAIEILTTEPCVVTKISNDPFLPITKARMTVADMDLQVGF